jgi:hypothetical protein
MVQERVDLEYKEWWQKHRQWHEATQQIGEGRWEISHNDHEYLISSMTKEFGEPVEEEGNLYWEVVPSSLSIKDEGLSWLVHFYRDRSVLYVGDIE